MNNHNQVSADGNGKKNNGHKKPEEIDWQIVREHLTQAEDRLARVDELSSDDLQEIWSRRADRMAQAIEDAQQGEQIELAVIRLGKELYGMDVRYVHDIRPLEHITRVPRVPAWVAGVVNLRGQIISVLDLHKYLGLPEKIRLHTNDQSAEMQHLVVVETDHMELAIQADDVLSIETFSVSKIHEASSTVNGIRPEYMRGIISYNSQPGNGSSTESVNRTPDGNNSSTLLIILDLPALLSDRQLVVHEEVL